MKLTELIDALQKARRRYGDLDRPPELWIELGIYGPDALNPEHEEFLKPIDALDDISIDAPPTERYWFRIEGTESLVKSARWLVLAGSESAACEIVDRGAAIEPGDVMVQIEDDGHEFVNLTSEDVYAADEEDFESALADEQNPAVKAKLEGGLAALTLRNLGLPLTPEGPR